jgi:hypothetical protein
MSDISSVTKYFPTVNEGFITTVGGAGVTAGGASVPFTSVSGLTNGSVFVGIVEPGQTNEQVFTGTVNTGTSAIDDVVWTRGSNADHAAGVTVVDYVTGTAINMMSAGFLKEHGQDGTHGALTVTSLTSSGALSGTDLTATGTTALATLSTTGAFTAGAKIVPKVTSLASGATLTPTSDTANVFVCDALAANTTIAAPTGTPANGQGLMLRIKDNGTSRTISWNAAYVAIGVTLPTATTASKKLYVAMRYNAADSVWDVLSVGRQA